MSCVSHLHVHTTYGELLDPILEDTGEPCNMVGGVLGNHVIPSLSLTRLKDLRLSMCNSMAAESNNNIVTQGLVFQHVQLHGSKKRNNNIVTMGLIFLHDQLHGNKKHKLVTKGLVFQQSAP